jgi:hypothetical protein
MMYDMRTSTLRPGTVEEFEARFAQRHPYREKHAQLGAFWHTRSCTSSLRVIPAAQKPVKIPPSTICVRGFCHGIEVDQGKGRPADLTVSVPRVGGEAHVHLRLLAFDTIFRKDLGV